LGDLTRELFALNRLGVIIGQQGDIAEAEQLFTEVHTRAVAAGNREPATIALNNLGAVAGVCKEYAAAREYFQQALALAREIGAQSSIALYLLNLAYMDIKLGQLAAAHAGLREGLALAVRLGALPWVVGAVTNFATLAYAEGRTERALALYGLARIHPAWSSLLQSLLDRALAEWALDPSVAEAGMKKGEELDWEETIQELLK
jgi:tetratricopeptide (TPR) repeat protein